MKLFITVDGQTMCVVVPDEETTIMVERDYQERLETAKDKAAVQHRTPQQILNTLYGREKDSQKRLHDHWVRPTSNDNEESGPDDYDSFAVARSNQGSGLNFHNLQNLSFGSAESQCVNAMAEDSVMQMLRANLTPDQLELVTEVIIKDKKQADYAAKKNVSEAAISQRLKTVLKKLRKILPKP